MKATIFITMVNVNRQLHLKQGMKVFVKSFHVVNSPVIAITLNFQELHSYIFNFTLIAIRA